jgi:integrase
MPAALTTRKLEALKPGKSRREIPDGGLPGLYVIVQPTGGLAWAVRYRFHRRPRKLTLGRYPVLNLKVARELGAKALREVAEGRDPAREKTRRTTPAAKDNGIEHLVAEFVTRHCERRLRPGSAKETARILRCYVLPAWRGWTVSEITRADIRALVEPMAETPVMANRTYKVVRRLFSWAVEQDVAATSPCNGMRAPFTETARDRVLTDAELLLIWRAAKTLGGPGGLLIRLLALSGQRRSECAGMRWDELDLQQGTWTLPASRVKNGRTHVVPLSGAAVELLQAVPCLGPFVVSPTGEHPTKDFAKIKRDIDALLPANMARWVLHDLRRSFASGLARLGIDLATIERALNHVSGSFRGVAGVYQRYDFQIEVRRAMNAWASRIFTLESGDRVVVPLRSGAR